MYKLIINLKTYKEGTNINSIKIAKICKKLEKEAKKKRVEIILCPVSTDIKNLIFLKVKVFSQNVDNYFYGANTGFLPIDLISDLKVEGSIINHSEHRLDFKEIKEKILLLKEKNLLSCLCVENTLEIKKYSKLKPDFIAVEPKELIGGNISISTAKPELIIKSVKASNKIPILVGAGVKNKNDVKVAVKLGAKGILVASGVVKAKNIKNAILDLLEGF